MTINDNKYRVNLEPTVITSGNREGLHGRIPGRAGESTIRIISSCHLYNAFVKVINLTSNHYVLYSLVSMLMMIIIIKYYSGTATASCPACGLASAASLLSDSTTTVN